MFPFQASTRSTTRPRAFADLKGTLVSKGQFHGNFGDIEFEGSSTATNFEADHTNHPVKLDARFQGGVSALNGDVALKDAKVSWNRTTVEAQGEIAGRPNQQGKTVSLSLTSPSGRIEDLMWLVSRRAPSVIGPADFRDKALLPPGDEKFIRKVQFIADFGITNARMAKPQTKEKVNKLSERARGDKDNDPREVLAHLKGRVALRNGIARFENTTFTVSLSRSSRRRKLLHGEHPNRPFRKDEDGRHHVRSVHRVQIHPVKSG